MKCLSYRSLYIHPATHLLVALLRLFFSLLFFLLVLDLDLVLVIVLLVVVVVVAVAVNRAYCHILVDPRNRHIGGVFAHF